MIRVDGLSLKIHGRTLLEDISFTLEEGRVYALLGENGSGKTTLMRCLSSFYPGYEGSIMFSGMQLKDCTRNEREHLHSLLPQTLASLDMGVEYMLSLTRGAAQVLSSFGLGHILSRRMDTLSGGERQMVYLAFAVARDAMLYLMDEPEASLDGRFRRKVESSMRRLADDGRIVLASFHDMNRALAVADGIIVLSKGRLVFSGSVSGFLETGIGESLFALSRRTLLDEDGSPVTVFL